MKIHISSIFINAFLEYFSYLTWNKKTKPDFFVEELRLRYFVFLLYTTDYVMKNI